MTFSDKLNKLRQETKLTRKAVAEQSGMSIATYSAYEDGRRLPKRNPENYEKLAAVFNCTPEYLKGDSDEADAAARADHEKASRKRPAPRKKAAPAEALPLRMEVQFGGQSISVDAIAEKARAVDAGITELYIKPEENVVYYVAGEASGSFELF